jgi:hypothetical protein
MKKSDFLLPIFAIFGAINLAFGIPTLVTAEIQPQEEIDDGIWAVNLHRLETGVATVVDDPVLTSQCMQHAAYMAQNQVASLSEDKNLATYSTEGSLCASHALIYLLPVNPQYNKASQIVDAWMASPTHRMWLLYPTLAAVGYGYAIAPVGKDWNTSSALDVLSGIDFSADGVYPNWPARYPAPGQVSVEASKVPITTWWQYAGPAPAVNLSTTTLKTSEGIAIPFTINSDPASYGGHKHITLLPVNPLAKDTIFVVHLEGSYNGEAFVYEWKFSTGTTAIPD